MASEADWASNSPSTAGEAGAWPVRGQRAGQGVTGSDAEERHTPGWVWKASWLR